MLRSRHGTRLGAAISAAAAGVLLCQTGVAAAAATRGTPAPAPNPAPSPASASGHKAANNHWVTYTKNGTPPNKTVDIRRTSDGSSTVHGDSLKTQHDNGYTASCGPAADVTVAAELLSRLGIGTVALYTGAGRTGSGCVVFTGNAQPIGTSFQVVGLTATNVANYTDEPAAVYSDLVDNLAAVVPAGADQDIPPTDVNFAFYPVGSTPPPDDRGLNPTAVFVFDPAS